jgi:hypothetical protein
MSILGLTHPTKNVIDYTTETRSMQIIWRKGSQLPLTYYMCLPWSREQSTLFSMDNTLYYITQQNITWYSMKVNWKLIVGKINSKEGYLFSWLPLPRVYSVTSATVFGEPLIRI